MTDVTQPPISASATGQLGLYARAFDATNAPSLISYPAHTVEVDAATFVTLAGSFSKPQRNTDINAQAVSVDPDVVCVQWRIDSTAEPDWTACQPPTSSTGATSTAGSGSGQFNVIAKGVQLTLQNPPEGVHTVAVRVRDALDNLAVSSAAVTIDRTPPALEITSGPGEGATIASSSVAFGFAAEAGADTQCAVDQPIADLGCAGKVTHTAGGLTDGPHTFIIRAVDAAGNASERSRRFNVALPPTAGDDGTTPPGFVPPGTGFQTSTATKRVSARISLKTTRGRTRRSTRRPWLTVTKVKNGSRITITCKAPKGRRRACPYKSKRYRVKDGRKTIGKRWRKRKLPKGTVITIRVTGSGAIGRAVRYTVRTGRRSPKRVVYCMTSGSTALRKRC